MTLLSAFESSLDDGHIAIYSCFETHETGTDRLATLVTSGDNALGHRYENVAYPDGRHIMICQFQTVNDPGFKIVKDLVYTITDQSIGRALNAFRNSFPTFGQQIVGFSTSELEKFIVSRQDRDRQIDTASDMGSVMLRRVKRILTQPVFGPEYVESLLSHG
ncbi:hypothetical protein B0T19DRAFT_262748 [Cercophora scortea]|uniref:Uncharacterized protein n=1 Tax=Cercophora scortea TaxID=314031 RepID=A0AAE0M7C3_9PEZI|nr:hypothetical protein B0T19DRAFT_262748 [Cercophora scortea]